MRRRNPYSLALGAMIIATVLAGPAGTVRAASSSAQAPSQSTSGAPGKAVASPGTEGAVGELPAEARGVEVVERVGDAVPRDLRFIDSTGTSVTIGELLDGNLPVILTFNYSSCPMLCSAQLRALVESMPKIPFVAGAQYRIITVGLDPMETADSAADTKESYLEHFAEDKRAGIAAGWQFLVGQESAIQALADATGFRYRYIEKTGEYSHPATLIFLSPTGIITRYYHGITYDPEDLGASIFSAGAGEYGVSVGFLLACFQPVEHKSYARTGERVMRYGTIGFVLFVLAAFGFWQWVRLRRARQEQTRGFQG